MTAGNDESTLSAELGRERAEAFHEELRPAFLIRRDGRLIVANHAAQALFDTALPSAGPAPGASRLRSFLQRAETGATLSENLRFFVGGRMESLRVQAVAFDADDQEHAAFIVFGEGPLPRLPERPQPVVAAVTSSVTETAPAVAANGERPTRFVFLTDAEGRIISLSPAFIAVTGETGRGLIGQSLIDIVAGSQPRNAGAIARAFLSRTAFSGIGFDWPPEGPGREAEVVLSGTPEMDAHGVLQGFSGVGHFQPIGTTAEAPVPAAVAEPVTQAPKVEATPQVEAPTLPEEPMVDTDGYEQALSRLESVLRDDEAEAVTAEEPDVVVDVTSLNDGAADAEEAEIADPQPETPAIPPQARQDNARPEGETVVPLRTLRAQVGASLGEQKIVPLKPGTSAPDQAVQRLSNAERNAFREIARALGARVEDQEIERPAPPPAAPQPPATPANHVAAAQAEISKALAAAHEQQERERSPQNEGLSDIIIERVPVGVLVFRGDRPLYLNKALLDLLSYRDLAEFDALRGLEKLFRGRAAPSFNSGDYDTVTIMGRDGETMPVDAHLQAIDWKGEHATMVTFRRAVEAEHGPRARSLDVELKARQAELAEARAMLDTATDGVISLDEGGRILALNKSAEALFGYDQNELTGERLTLLLAPESHAAALDYIDGLKTGGVASVLNDGREIVGRERKGGRIPMFMTIGRISETGKFAAVLRDLTAWKRAESELTEAKRAAERSSALKSDFLAKVSHEIRTPMNAIIGFAEVMRDERLGPIGTERYKDYLKDIHTSGEHVISLVNDLLDLSKIEAGRMELSFGSVDLNAIVTSCLGIMQPQANRDRVIMRSQLSAKLPPVVADERSIRQIILNLLSNASKFTEPGGQVIVSTALTDNGEAVIRVRDTGVGMTEAEVQAAMEPFRQLSNARGRGGTGLGLPLTKALVEANRAVFTIRSKAREGTLVEITFPPTRVLAE